MTTRYKDNVYIQIHSFMQFTIPVIIFFWFNLHFMQFSSCLFLLQNVYFLNLHFFSKLKLIYFFVIYFSAAFILFHTLLSIYILNILWLYQFKPCLIFISLSSFLFCIFFCGRKLITWCPGLFIQVLIIIMLLCLSLIPYFMD